MCQSTIIVAMRIPSMSMGDKCGEYRLIRKIGEGGIGTVWLGHDPGLDRHVAIKSLRPEYEKNSVLARRFLREAKATARLSHPNIVTIYQIALLANGQPYIVMEYLDSGSLSDRVKAAGVLNWQDACRFAADAACGLAEAHAAGIIHRDVKPANLMLTSSGGVKVVDFGLAHAETIEPELTHPGAFLGSPSYVSPEQAAGSKPTPASDIYALSVTLHVLLTGKLPFVHEDSAVVLEHHRLTPFPDVRKMAPGTPQKLAEYMQQMAAKAAGDRPASMKEVERFLRMLAAGEELPAKEAEKSEKPIVVNFPVKARSAPVMKKSVGMPKYAESIRREEAAKPAAGGSSSGPVNLARLMELSKQVEQSRASGNSAAEMNGWRELYDEYTRMGRDDDARLAARRAMMLYTQLHRPGEN